MKPTEQDIQAELIEGWEIAETSRFGINNKGWFIVSNGNTRITVFQIGVSEIDFNHEGEPILSIKHKDFLTGNYDLSAISQHYEPEEWQRIISMCERIVRLITGEQTLEEKVRRLVYKDDTVLEITNGKVVISNPNDDCDVSITSSTIGFNYSSLAKTGSNKTFETDDYRTHAPLGLNARGKSYVAISDLLRESEKAALLTPSDQPEQTLEEAVRNVFDGNRDIEIEVIGKSEVRVGFTGRTDIITSDGIRDGSPRDFYSVDELEDSPFADDYVEQIEQICSLLVPKSEDTELSKCSTKPSYSDLEQLVEELEKEAIRYEERISTHAGTIKTLEKDVERLERENASLLDRFGPIDQAEQQAAEAQKEFETFTEKVGRWAQGIIQLNEEIL